MPHCKECEHIDLGDGPVPLSPEDAKSWVWVHMATQTLPCGLQIRSHTLVRRDQEAQARAEAEKELATGIVEAEVA
jgi:hypothetical protein